MFQIHFVREGRTGLARAGERLMDVMLREQFRIDAPCGGRGKCGKCRVRIASAPWSFADADRIPGAAETEEVLACQYRAQRELWVDTSPLDDLDTVDILMRHAAGGEETFSPPAFWISVKVPPCPRGKSISDWTRFARAVKEETGRQVLCSPRAASQIGKAAGRQGGEVFALVHADEVLCISDQRRPFYMAAFDIGTTTVAGYLLSGEDGSELASAGIMNPQTRYGADVINRANYALEHGGEELARCIREAVDGLLEQMARQAGIPAEQIYFISVAGNTCMHHLFLEISVDSLVHAPYNPAVSDPMVLRAGDYGLHANRDARLYMLPNIAGFVGADTVACLTSVHLAEQEEWTLLVDIGTNGEMALGRGGDLAVCSTAAGPAFEGAGIRCGMRGSEGAISKARWDGERWELSVIGETRAKGICGSGLLDLAAELLRSGQMDETGQLKDKTGQIVLGEGVVLEQKDIRQLQLAKAAIASGIHLLSEKMGIGPEQIQKVWLAGAFGSFLSPQSACRIGLIPPVLEGRIEAVGNAAGAGARAVLNSREAWEYAARTAKQAQFLELASLPHFQDRFVEELEFPEEGENHAEF